MTTLLIGLLIFHGLLSQQQAVLFLLKIAFSLAKSTFSNDFRDKTCICHKKTVTLQPKVAKLIDYVTENVI